MSFVICFIFFCKMTAAALDLPTQRYELFCDSVVEQAELAELPEFVDRGTAVIRFLRKNGSSLLDLELGKQLTSALLDSNLLEGEACEDLEEILVLPPGWADEGGGNNAIPSSAYSVASRLLLLLYLTDHLPDNLVPSPRQTINFKFGSFTLLVDGTNTLSLFDRLDFAASFREFSLKNTYEELTSVLSWTPPAQTPSKAAIVHALNVICCDAEMSGGV